MVDPTNYNCNDKKMFCFALRTLLSHPAIIVPYREREGNKGSIKECNPSRYRIGG